MATVPVFAPDGTLGDVPKENLAAAVSKGFKPGVNMIASDGTKGVVPADRYVDAVSKGKMKVAPFEDQEIQHPGFWAALGDDLKGMVKGAASFAQAGLETSSGNPLPMSKIASDTAETVQSNMEHRVAEGRSLPYRVIAPVGDVLGVNTRGMEDAADQGDVAGVAGHASAVPVAMAATEGLAHGAVPLAEALKTGAKAAVGPVATGLKAASDVISPDVTGIFSPRLAHAQRLASKVADLADAWRTETKTAPGAYAGQPEAPSPELLQSRALAQPGTSPVDPSAGLGKLPVQPEEVRQASGLAEGGKAAPKPQAAALESLPVKQAPPEPAPVYPGAPEPATPDAAALQARALKTPGATPPKGHSVLGDIPVSAYLQAEKELGPEASVTSKLERAQSLSQRLDTTLREAVGNKPVEPGVPLKNQGKADISQTTLAAPEGHTPVESSALSTYKYDPAAKEFSVTTPTGGHYIYGDVSPDQASAFENAESKGKAWNDIRQNSTLVAKVINGKRVPVKSVASASVDPLAQTHDDLTAILQKSLEAAKKPGASQ